MRIEDYNSLIFNNRAQNVVKRELTLYLIIPYQYIYPFFYFTNQVTVGQV